MLTLSITTIINGLSLEPSFKVKVESTAIKAALSAGNIMIQAKPNRDISSKIGDRDIVTESDKACQEVICSTIATGKC